MAQVLELCTGDLRDHVLRLRKLWFPDFPASGSGQIPPVFDPAVVELEASAQPSAGQSRARDRARDMLGLLKDTAAVRPSPVCHLSSGPSSLLQWSFWC